jgi:hypothetical protein
MFCMGVKLDFLDLGGAGREGVEWIYLAQNENTKSCCEHGYEPVFP